MSSTPLLQLFDQDNPLDQISEAKLREIALLLEEARDQPDVQTIMERIRPRLQRIRPVRKPSLQRLFYLPFEDLLGNGAKQADAGESAGRPADDGRIPRRAAQRAWDFVLARNDSAERRIYKIMEARLRGLDPQDAGGQRVLARRMWPAAAKLLEEAAVTAATNRALRQDLLGDQIELIDAIRQIARTLAVGEEIQLLKDALPPAPIRGLDISQMALIRQTVAAAHDGKPDRAYPMLLAILVRMSAPSEFLRRVMQLNLDLPMPIKLAVFTRLGRTVLADLERQSQALAAAAIGDFATRVERAQFLVGELAAADQVLRDADPQTKQRLADLHQATEAACTGLFGAAASCVQAALGRAAQAPLEVLVAAEAAVIALRRSQPFARQVELDRKLGLMLSMLVRELKIKSVALFERLGGLDASEKATPERVTIERDLYWCVRMIELAGDPDEADRIRLDRIKGGRAAG